MITYSFYFYSLFSFCIFKVISSSLKTLGKVLDTARPEFITELFSSGTTTEETSRKRARLDHSPPCEEEGKQMTAVRTREKLAFVLYRRLRDSRWEVRDSTLEFVGSLLQLNHGTFLPSMSLMINSLL